MLKSLVGWQRYAVFGLFALLLVAAIVMGVKSCKEIDQENDNMLVNSGEVLERNKGNERVINDVQEARDAVERPTDAERNVVCSKYDRNC